MGFFVRACVQALKEIPAVNAEIDGADIIYKNYYHIGVAVGTERGLVVPVVRDCDTKSLAEIEKEIADFGRRARDGALKIEEMQGGTFTITNGGVYGSLMSTPILNAPQSGILGMHKIQERPMVVDGKIVIRPMMYLALSYDHRIVDGREAVTFLVRVKEVLEDPGAAGAGFVTAASLPGAAAGATASDRRIAQLMMRGVTQGSAQHRVRHGEPRQARRITCSAICRADGAQPSSPSAGLSSSPEHRMTCRCRWRARRLWMMPRSARLACPNSEAAVEHAARRRALRRGCQALNRRRGPCVSPPDPAFDAGRRAWIRRSNTSRKVR